MNRVLQVQPTSIISIDEYSRKHKLNQSKSHHASAKRGRTRGVVLSDQGWQKLMQAGALHNKFGERCTYEQLSERSQLDERTVSRLLSCEVRVDKNTLRSFFRAFDLSLEAGDYTAGKSERTTDRTPASRTFATATIQRVEFEQVVEELTQLKQRLREYDRLFHRLGLNKSHDSVNLSSTDVSARRQDESIALQSPSFDGQHCECSAKCQTDCGSSHSRCHLTCRGAIARHRQFHCAN